MKMREHKVQEEFVNVCKCLYEGVEASVLLGGECSRWFEVEAGLRQGCPLCPVLYSAHVMELLKDLEENKLGIEVEGAWCGGLLYVYDIVLLRDQVELKVMLDVVGKYMMKLKFRFNSKKSKYCFVCLCGLVMEGYIKCELCSLAMEDYIKCELCSLAIEDYIKCELCTLVMEDYIKCELCSLAMEDYISVSCVV